MANGIVLVAVVAALTLGMAGLILVLRRRRPQAIAVPAAMPPSIPTMVLVPPPQEPLPIIVEAKIFAAEPAPVLAPSPVPVPVPAPAAVEEDRNQKILAGISENLRRNPVKPLPRFSPIEFPQTTRETEYIRVKKQIITPHGQVRFSILKDTLATNMLAVFRRASLDWKTPEDLIGFIPTCLEPQAEVLNGRILLIGTPGHPETLAVPIRSIDDDEVFRDCFELYTDVRPSRNTPAVLLRTGGEFELVSKGALTQILFEVAV